MNGSSGRPREGTQVTWDRRLGIVRVMREGPLAGNRPMSVHSAELPSDRVGRMAANRWLGPVEVVRGRA